MRLIKSMTALEIKRGTCIQDQFSQRHYVNYTSFNSDSNEVFVSTLGGIHLYFGASQLVYLVDTLVPMKGYAYE